MLYTRREVTHAVRVLAKFARYRGEQMGHAKATEQTVRGLLNEIEHALYPEEPARFAELYPEWSAQACAQIAAERREEEQAR